MAKLTDLMTQTGFFFVVEGTRAEVINKFNAATQYGGDAFIEFRTPITKNGDTISLRASHITLIGTEYEPKTPEQKLADVVPLSEEGVVYL